MIPVIVVLAAGTALMILAQWRGWRPGLRTALAAGIVLRVAVWGLAVATMPQPWDFANDFPAAAAAVLHHQDPVLNNPGRWHLLPFMPFVLAAELKLSQLAQLSWLLAGKLVTVAADVALIPLVGRLAGNRCRLAAFQYACNPVSIMVCAIHGQFEPVSLVLGAGAFLVARSQRATAAGILAGLSAATGGWPVLLFPGILLALEPGSTLTQRPWVTRRRVQAVAWAAAVPLVLLVSSPLTVGTPVRQLPHVARLLVGARYIVGDWGWTAVITAGMETGDGTLSKIGKVLLIAALLATLYLWRRADPLRLTAALLIAFLVVTPRLGVQYLMFPVPFVLALGGRAATPATVASAVWQAIGYTYLAVLSYTGWLAAHRWWALSSLVVIGVLIAAMNWSRRDGQLTGAAAGTSSSKEEAAGTASAACPFPPGGSVPSLPSGLERSAKSR